MAKTDALNSPSAQGMTVLDIVLLIGEASMANGQTDIWRLSGTCRNLRNLLLPVCSKDVTFSLRHAEEVLAFFMGNREAQAACQSLTVSTICIARQQQFQQTDIRILTDKRY